ncbi:MAG: acylphosphatase [Candidatus Aenigmarchaeota archaeon]|nr:acylphosphatase [Candidatus Aenigmarchaeota archaeon]
MDSARAHITVSGMFHGMFFRSDIRTKARNLSLKGWIKKSQGGNFEIVAEGDRQAIETLVNYIKNGEFTRVIISMDVKWADFAGEFKGFEIISEDFA